MQIKKLTETFQKVEATSLRNEKTELLAGLLKEAKLEELEGVGYLSLGRLGPLYSNPDFGLAEKMVIRALAWGLGVEEEKVKAKYKALGDMGAVAQEYKDDGEGRAMTVKEVYEELLRIANDVGTGSQERKVRGLGRLVAQIDGMSAKYVVRIVLSKMRLGFFEMTFLDALSMAKVGDKSQREELERAYNVVADIVQIAKIYHTEGLEGLVKIEATPGIPIRVAKAERIPTIEEILAKLGNVAVEPKMDGMRVQVHVYPGEDEVVQGGSLGLFEGKSDGVIVKVFSRGLDDVTEMFPEIVEAGKEVYNRTKQDFILDAEAIGYDVKSGKFLPFQETVKRKRKYEVTRTAEEIPLRVFAFDLLYIGGETLLKTPYKERRAKLKELLPSEDPGGSEVLVRARMQEVNDPKKADKLFRGYLEERLEGAMFKKLDSLYQAGARSYNWVKFKRAQDGELTDTLDCVVMGYYVGRGKRQQFGLGAFLVGVMGKGEKIVTVSKIGTGLTDEQWREMFTRINKVETKEKSERYVVEEALRPDGWVQPEIVVEIIADEITKSPLHSAGYALRFPRLVRFRDDKKVTDITTLDEVVKLHRI